jgi:hypothetical protein
MSNLTRARVATWTHLMSGGFSHIAHFESGSDPLSASWQTTWDHANPRHKQDAAELGRLHQFFNLTSGIDIGRCVPHNELISVTGGNLALCLAEPGESYYVWLDRGGAGSLNLAGAPGQYSVTRYRCTQLASPVSLPVVVGGGSVNLGATPTTGFGNDYLFVLKAFSPRIPGDFDHDGDVDISDFAHLQICFTPDGMVPAAGCGDADLNADNIIDLVDLNVFTTCLNGAGQPPACL